MSSSTSHRRGAHSRGAHGGQGGDGPAGGGGGGGDGGGGGPLVKVAFARNQVEAEMLQALLMEGGVPSVLKRSRGFDNPDFLASGPHDVLVAAPAEGRARELLSDTALESEGEERAELAGEAELRRQGSDASPRRLALWLGLAFLAAVVLVWLLYQLS